MRFDDISIGYEIPALTKSITQDMIDGWAEVSTDFNPLHVNPEYARKTKFGGTIAHGHISLSFLCEMMHRWLGHGWLSGGRLMEVKFIAPIRPGYNVAAKGTVVEKRTEGNRNIVKSEIFIENQHGEKCVVGFAEGIVID